MSAQKQPAAVAHVRPQAHPALELLARYRAVLQAAWQARAELAGPKRLADETAFLPAALEIQDAPVHPAPRRATWLIMALFATALAWSFFGQVDIVAVAPGRIVVSERTKVVQPLEPGVIKAIHVRDGDKVQAGQLLIELDPTQANADRQGVQEQQQAAQGEWGRADALLQALASGRSPTLATKTGPAARNAPAQQQLQAEWADIQAKLARLGAEFTRRDAEIATTQAQLAKLQTLLPLARQREADFQALAQQGFMSSHANQDRTRERIEIERDLTAQQARLLEAKAAHAESGRARAAFLAETQRNLNERLAKARLDAQQLQQQGTKTELREQLTRLTSPVAGTVQQLQVHSAGGVVTAAQTLMVIVPDGAALSAEVVIENKDIGFVNAGQAAEIKVETFSFTRYGTVPAKVSWVTPDAVNDEKRGAIFPALIELQGYSLDVNGKPVRLAAGMAVTVEIKTGRRRVIDFLLSPITASVDQSLRER